jgi:hypothetical protein
MLVSLFTENVAGVAPKLTELADVKFVPVTTTENPLKPELGLTPVTVGADGTV